MRNSLLFRWMTQGRHLWMLGAASLLLTGCMATMPPAGSDAAFGASGAVAERYGSTVESRSGLGTGWGEHRSSNVTGTEFVRATRAPAARTSIYYNDREGINDMIHRYGSERVRAFDVGGIATVEIRTGGWRGTQGYRFGGRNYIVGKDGQRYSVRVTNRTHRRIEVVLSVDGLDVLDGKSASTSKPGYAVAPRGSLTVDGWRTSMSSVAAFRFGSVSDSYAARKGAGTRNVGVIGAAVFQEKNSGPVLTHRHHDHGIEAHRRHGADPFPSEGRFAAPPR